MNQLDDIAIQLTERIQLKTYFLFISKNWHLMSYPASLI